MSQLLEVSNSMRAKDRDGNPKSWESQYGTFEVWNVYFKDDDTKYQVNKKEGFGGYTRGQQVYGSLTTSQYGGQFKQEQAPDDMHLSSGTSPSPSAQATTSKPSADQGDKLDYIISLLENFLDSKSSKTVAPKTADTIVTDIDDKPVDLSEIDY